MIRVARTYVQAWSSQKDDESHPLFFFKYVGYHFLCLVSFENTVFGISTTFPRYLTKHDLHRKFGSEMATKRSRKIDGENLSPRFRRAVGAPTSLPARRGGPCKRFEAHGLTAFGLFPHKSLQEQAPDVLARKSPALCAELQIVCGERGSGIILL